MGMKKSAMKKCRIILFVLLGLLLVSAADCPSDVYAAKIIARGECGEKVRNAQGEKEGRDLVKWKLNSRGVMTIYGMGRMEDCANWRWRLWGGNDQKIKKLVIKEGVTNIGICTFQRCRNLSQIVLPESLEVIDTKAFEGCTSLKEVTLPDSIRYVGPTAFANCQSLKKIKFPDSACYIEDWAFWGCTGLERVTLPAAVAYWGEKVFWKCTGIKYIEVEKETRFLLPGELCDVYGDQWHVTCCSGYGMFTDCGDIRKVVFPKDIPVVPTKFLSGCQIEEVVNFPGKNSYIGSYPQIKGKKRYRVPEGVEALQEGCFRNCTYEEIILPKGLKRIGARSFEGTPITGIKIPDTVEMIEEEAFLNGKLEKVIIPDSVKSIGQSAFEGCVYLKKIVLPKELTCISMGMLYGTAIQTIHIPKGVTAIESAAFMNCKQLQKVHIPAGVNKMGVGAFEGCDGLKRIKLPNSMKVVEPWIVKDCINLEEVVLPKEMEKMEDDIFQGCTSLKTIRITSKNLREVQTDPFYGVEQGFTIYVPEEKLQEYQELFAQSVSNMDRIQWKTI